MTSRFLPKAQSPIIHGGDEPVDATWYRYMRSLGIDLDAAQADIVTNAAAISSHSSAWPAHGWTRLANKVLTVGLNTIAHGLTAEPTEVIPYHSDASGLNPGYMYASKNGAQDITTGDWRTITGWTETDPNSCFDATNGIWTAPRTGIYTHSAGVYIETVTAATVNGIRFLSSSGWQYQSSITRSVTGGAIVPLTTDIACTTGDTIKLEAVVAVNTKIQVGPYTQWRVTPRLGVDAYSFDATNIYVHSDYAHTRSFLVR